MRTRAGIVLIEDNKVALIERHRAGLDYFVFPGGGVDEGETPEQAAVREAMEELGVEFVCHQIADGRLAESRPCPRAHALCGGYFRARVAAA